MSAPTPDEQIEEFCANVLHLTPIETARTLLRMVFTYWTSDDDETFTYLNNETFGDPKWLVAIYMSKAWDLPSFVGLFVEAIQEACFHAREWDT